MIEFDTEIDASKVRASLQELMDRVSYPARMRFLRRTGVRMVRSITINFEKQGRPTKWKGLAPSTIKRRKKGQRARPKILKETGRLWKSIAYDVDPRGELVEIGTNVEYSPYLQEDRIHIMFQEKDFKRIMRDAQDFAAGRHTRGTYRGK